MKPKKNKFPPYLLVILLTLSFIPQLKGNMRIAEVRKRVVPTLDKTLAAQGLARGDRVYLRVFKHEDELELWMKPKNVKMYKLFQSYPIAGMSGTLGPKLKEGDYQAPEGFYNIVKGNLNPKSSYHLSFNIGYPNSYDRAHKRTGSFIMVHGSNVSVGCYAMTDPVIEVIYILVEEALKKGQSSIPFHSFPFRYTENWVQKEKSKWVPFWQEIEPAYWIFQKEKRVPKVSVNGRSYSVK